MENGPEGERGGRETRGQLLLPASLHEQLLLSLLRAVGRKSRHLGGKLDDVSPGLEHPAKVSGEIPSPRRATAQGKGSGQAARGSPQLPVAGRAQF